MSAFLPGHGATAAWLAREFDLSFARAPEAAVEKADFLAIRVRAAPYALRLAEVGALAVDRKLTPLPSEAPALLGIAGLRGAILPVYDLGSLLGDSSPSAPRWLALLAGGDLAVAFDAFEGHLRLPASAVAPAVPAPAVPAPAVGVPTSSGPVREVLAAEGGARPLVSLLSILEAIRRQAAARPQKER